MSLHTRADRQRRVGGAPTGFRRAVILAVLVGSTALGGCGLFGDDEKAALEGRRLSVLPDATSLQADPSLKDVEIQLPPAWRNAAWTQDGGYGGHAMHHLAAPKVLKQAWRASIGVGSGGERRLLAAPIVVGGRVYALDADTRAVALDASDGRRLWQTDLAPDGDPEGGYGGGLALEGGRLFATTGFGEVIALDPANGEEIWRTDVGAPMRGAPAVGQGRVVAVTFDNEVVGLSVEDGTEAWRHVGVAEGAGVLGGAAPAIDGALVVAPYSSGDVVGLRVDTGRVAWAETLANVGQSATLVTMADIEAAPVIDRDVVVAASNGGRLAVLESRTGNPIWERALPAIEMPWVAGEQVFVVTRDAELAALRRRDGRVYWVTRLPRYEDEEDREDPILWSGPVLAGERLLLTSTDGRLVSVSPYDGAIQGEVDVGAPVRIAPVVAQETVYILRDDGVLLAYR